MDRKELTDLTQSIATALGSNWVVDEDNDNWARPIRDLQSNAKLYVSGEGYNSKTVKCVVSGSQHIGENGKYVEVYQTRPDGSGWEKQIVPSISVTIARGPEVIAKEIKRRLLPEYLRILALAEVQVEKDRLYESQKRFNVKVLAEAANQLGVTDKQDSFSLSLGEIYGRVEVSGKTADVRLRSLTIAQAEKVLRFARTL